ncbi:MAG: aminotransferase class III-fold pyridoxal phosphate-dependent enzyme [Acidimicrobiales bacterium]
MTGPPAFLHPFARPAATEFLDIVRGEGAAVFDAAGRRYVDAMASLWYCQIGHGRLDVAEAVADQVRTLESFQAFERFTNPVADAFCEELAALAPMPDARVFLTSSGSEAVDSALKLARLTFSRQGRPERHVVLARHHAYHGVTYGGMTAQGLPGNKEGFGPLLEGVHHVAHDDLAEVEAAFADGGDRIAAVLAEPVIGAGGVRPVDRGYFVGLRRLCDEHGALLILDEVICGFGRLGTWWGADRLGVEPDLVTFAKGATSGYQPLGGVLVGPAVREVLEADAGFVLRHGHTYSGHATACRAGLVNLAVLRDEGLLAAATRIGERLGPRLQGLADDGLVAAVRGLEGIWAVDLAPGRSAVAAREALLAEGVIVRPIGDTTLAMCPPLVIDDDDLDRIVAGLHTVLSRPG